MAKKRTSTSSSSSAPRSRAPRKSAAATPAKRTSVVASAPAAPVGRRYWLVKTEPESFSIDDLAQAPRQTTCWEGVRNYQARNFMRDQMKLGDEVLVYHSNADPPCAVGVARVVKEAYPDSFAWDPKSKYYDPDSTRDDPTWVMVDLQLVRKFPRPLPLDELRRIPALAKMELLRKGSRLSVQPVTSEEYAAVLAAAESL